MVVQGKKWKGHPIDSRRLQSDADLRSANLVGQKTPASQGGEAQPFIFSVPTRVVGS